MNYKTIGVAVTVVVLIALFIFQLFIVFKPPNYLVKISDRTYYHKDSGIVYIQKGSNYDPLFDAMGNVVIWKEAK